MNIRGLCCCVRHWAHPGAAGARSASMAGVRCRPRTVTRTPLQTAVAVKISNTHAECCLRRLCALKGVVRAVPAPPLSIHCCTCPDSVLAIAPRVQHDRDSCAAQARCGGRGQGPRGHAGARSSTKETASLLLTAVSCPAEARDADSTEARTVCSSSSSRASPSSRRSSSGSAARLPRRFTASMPTSPSTTTSSPL